MNDVFKNIKTIDGSLFESYKNGEITIRKAAEEFYSAGWTHFVDEDYTIKKFERLSGETLIQKVMETEEDYLRRMEQENKRLFGIEYINIDDAYKAIKKARKEERERIFLAIKNGESIDDIEEEINRHIGWFKLK